jgi:hypothetical protein
MDFDARFIDELHGQSGVSEEEGGDLCRSPMPV